MSAIHILVASVQPDVVAEGILAEIRKTPGMRLLTDRVLEISDIRAELEPVGASMPCAIVCIGKLASHQELPFPWMEDRPALVVVRATLDDDLVHFDARNIGIEQLLATIMKLAQQRGRPARERVAHLPLRSGSGNTMTATRPLLGAALAWIHAMMKRAVDGRHGTAGDLPGLTVSLEAVQSVLDEPLPLVTPGLGDSAADLEKELLDALAAADPDTEPLAALYLKLDLDLIEWKLLLLALAPELDIKYQKCVGFLLDDLGRRAGTMGLLAPMLGDGIGTRRRLAASGRLASWWLFGYGPGNIPASDEPLHVEACVAAWLLGRGDALEQDRRLRPALRSEPWNGMSLLRAQAGAYAVALVRKLRDVAQSKWVVLAGDDPPAWRAMVECGACGEHAPVRCELCALAALDAAGVEEVGARLGRLARLTGKTVVLDAAASEWQAADENALRVFVSAMAAAGQRAIIIAARPAPVFRALGAEQATLIERIDPQASASVSAVNAAAADLRLALDDEEAEQIRVAFPLPIDALQLAARLARARARGADDRTRLRERLLLACREIASERMSSLAKRVVPVFRLADVILPPDRRTQLDEIVAHVRLAPKVLGEWRMGERLPYGRGVSALFHGPSGTGKTMAAQAIAHELDIEIYALDLSRVVSKYIGETEKNIEAVFTDAQRSGAAVLIDEADALFGKRSEVKDAHDRYANIEVAYLLQRMESYEGLAILTTNIRQNLDPAFLRRLRFVLEFPRPDAVARERIWRQCLPDESHELSDADFRLLGRKVELTGGHIRQITVRAAFAAAAESRRVGMGHVGQAVNAEFTKLGLPATILEPIGKAA